MELVSFILTNLWAALQMPQERSVFVKNITLVNRMWLTLVTFITSHDVHLANSQDANTFIGLLVGSCVVSWADGPFTAERTHISNDACRFITFYVDDIPPPGMSRPAGEDAISLVLRTISTPGHVPNLQHIALWYTDLVAFFDTFKRLEQGPFLPQVAHLSVNYVLSDYPFPGHNAKSIILWLLWTVDTIADSDTRDNTCRFCSTLHKAYYGGAFPVTISPIWNLQHLALSGVMMTFVTAILQVCPNTETLEIVEPGEVRLFAIPPLPTATTTLILRCLGAVPRGLLLQWNLCYVLESRLFCACTRAHGVTPHIIVHSGTPDPMAFLEMRRCCQCFSVKLVHEPDSS